MSAVAQRKYSSVWMLFFSVWLFHFFLFFFSSICVLRVVVMTLSKWHFVDVFFRSFGKHVFSRLTLIAVLTTHLNMRSLKNPSFLQRSSHVGKFSWPLLSLLAITVPALNWLEHKAERLRGGKDSYKVGRKRRERRRGWKLCRTRGHESQILVCLFIYFSSFMWLSMVAQTPPCRLSTYTSLESEFTVRLMESEEGLSICFITFIKSHLSVQQSIKI